MGEGALCIEDNIDFCGESRFLDGVTGVYHTPKGYYVNEARGEEFDQNFPPKENQKLPGQMF